MAYKKELDKVVKEWLFPLGDCVDETIYLKASLRKYDKGSLKLQLGPRQFCSGGKVQEGKLGRLKRDEVFWLLDVVKETIEFFEKENNTKNKRE